MAKGEEEVVAVGPGADEDDVREESAERREEEGSEEGQDEDERAKGSDEEEEGEERVGHADDDQDDEREQVRRRRRAEKQRKKENRQRDRTELSFLRQRNEQLERRQSELDARVANGEIVQIDSKIAELEGQIREAERIKAIAISKGDGDSATEADRIAHDLRTGRSTLVAVRGQRVEGAKARASGAGGVDPQIQAAAREWAESHDWYDPNLRNADSRVAKAVEDQIFNEGRLDARTPEYWEELDRRLKKYMPHRYGNGHQNVRGDDDEREDEGEEREERREERRPRGPRITTGGRERPLRKNEVYVSAERKAAMIEAGVWDDEKLRARYLKQYQKFDREHRRS